MVSAIRTSVWRSSAAAAAGAVVCALVPLAAGAQYFGRNKVLWEELEFEILDTPHFSIHYYPPDSPAAPYVARLSERWYARLSDLFDHELKQRNPLIIYQDHADFQQTLATSGLIGEGTGGFTESLQNRVVLPLTGVNGDNDHVLGHELVHAFQFDMLEPRDDGTAESQVPPMPLWLSEGLAEYLSQGYRDPQTAMWMRDAVLHDRLPDPAKMSGLELSPYQYGQAVWAYIGGRWGDRAAARLFRQAGRVGFAAAVRADLQIEPAALFADLHTTLRTAYQPVLDARSEARTFALPLVPADAAHGARLNVAPALSPDGTKLAFLSSLELFTIDLFLADAQTGEVLEKLASADSDSHYDALSFIDSSVAWSPDSRRLAFTVFAKGERRLVLFDVVSRRVERELTLAGIKGASGPAWSPDGRYLAFAAIVDGASELYRVDVESSKIKRLTADSYTSIQPAFSPDGRTLVFVTDRGPAADANAARFDDLHLALLDLMTLAIEPLPIFENGKHIDPYFSDDGESILFVGEPDGVPDVFRYDLKSQATERLTALKTGVTGVTAVSPALSVAADTGAIAFSVLEDGRFNIYRMDASAQEALDEPAGERAAILPPGEDSPLQLVQRYLVAPDADGASTFNATQRPYRRDLELAYVGAATVGVSVDSYGTGIGGSLSAYYTDQLGTRQLGATVYGGTSGGYMELEDALGGEAVYLDQNRRLQWGAVVSRLPYLSGGTYSGTGVIDGEHMPADFIYNELDIVTATEISMFAQYPLSLTRRVEASVGVSHIGHDRTLERFVIPAAGDPYWETFDLPSPPALDLRRASTAFVFDNSHFGFMSPTRGRRFRLESEWTTGDLEFHTAIADYRHYFFLNPLTVALRALHVGRRGDDAEDPRLSPLDVGRDTLVRGYELDSFDVSACTSTAESIECPVFERVSGSRIAVINLELRVPLLGTSELGLFRAPSFPTEAVVFLDVGAAWSEGQSVEWKFERNTDEHVPVVSAGIAIRTLLGGVLPLTVFYARPYQRPGEDGVFGLMIATGW